jgi:hypothetical protein
MSIWMTHTSPACSMWSSEWWLRFTWYTENRT